MSQKKHRPGHMELMNHRGREPIQPPRVLEHIRKSVLSSAEQLLAHLFSATDDLFYDLSKRASSNSEQNLYFEAMREIRIKREGIANLYLRSLADLFSSLIEFHKYSDLDEFSQQSAQNLSIVEGDDLEVDLARGNMVSRTRDIFKEELYELSTRLDHLLLQIEVNEDNNPLDPQQLTDVFIEACQDKLDVNIKAKLILYKLFEKHVLKQLGNIYADANQVLMDAGILPKVPKMNDKRVLHGGVQQGHAASEAQPSGTSSPQPTIADFRMGYDTLAMLMTAVRSAGVQAPNQIYMGQPTAHANSAQNGFTCYVYTGNPGPVMASPELTSLLSHSQPQFDQQLASSGQPRNIIAEVIQQLLSRNDPNTPNALEQNDENVINLVAMFFDQILADDNLPVAVQSLVCRLQIPILKVALKDRSFFNNPEHPARQLINAMTDAGMGFDETKPLERDPLFKKMVEIVQTINRQYKADDRIFTELQAELERTIERERRKASMVEQRTTQTEAGKSRIKQARTIAQTVMYKQLKDVKLPEVVNEFLTKYWLQVMVITHLKHGAESNEWVTAEQTITDLIWISRPHEDVRSKQRRERLFPELLDRIEAGLVVAIDNPELRAEKVGSLEQTLQSIAATTPDPQDFDDAFDTTFEMPAAAPEPEAAAPKLAPLNEEQKDALGKGENAPKTWDEMTAVERQQARYEELSGRYYELAKELPEGSWVEYFDDDSGKKLRCKLTSKIDADTYIFVNRFGFKVLEKSRKQFAYDMQFNRAKLLDTNPLFDRIMGNVVTNLTQDNAQTPVRG